MSSQTLFRSCVVVAFAGIFAWVGPRTPSALPGEVSVAVEPADEKPQPEIRFRDLTAEAGIDFEHPAAPEMRYIVEAVSGGVALFDYDRDGRLDIYLVNSLTVATAGDPRSARSALYRNLGDWTFEDVAESAGVAFPGWGMGVCVADVDGDGWQDLYVTGLENNHFYRNLQGKTFADVTAEANVGGGGWSTGCGFADFDRDGDLDLFVSRYLDIGLANLPAFGKGQLCTYRNIPVHCGPRGLPGRSDLFYLNNGKGIFTEAGREVGVFDPEGMFGLGIAWVDVDADGWLDLFVANDTKPNFLYLNRKDGTFEEMAFLLGVAVSEDGKQQGSMGVAVGDYLNQGRPSFFVTNFAEEYNALYRNQGSYFTDASFRSSTALPSLPYVGWGTSFLDADNDGWLDLLLLNGHVYPQMKDLELAASAPFRQRAMLYRNRRDGTFQDVTAGAGDSLRVPEVGRGLAVGDLDDDGRLDVVINNLVGKARVLRNETATSGHWLRVELAGRAGATNGLGARITVRTGDKVQHRWVQSGTGYLSQDDMRQHFGLANSPRVDAVEVLWPDGSRSTVEDISSDQTVRLEQQGEPTSAQ